MVTTRCWLAGERVLQRLLEGSRPVGCSIHCAKVPGEWGFYTDPKFRKGLHRRTWVLAAHPEFLRSTPIGSTSFNLILFKSIRESDFLQVLQQMRTFFYITLKVRIARIVEHLL